MAVSEDLRARLSSADEGERHRALRELAGACSPEEALPLLRAASGDPSRLVRFLARELLAEAGDPDVAVPGRPRRRPPPVRGRDRELSWLLFSFEGRIGRFTYWTSTLVLTAVSWMVSLGIATLFKDSAAGAILLLVVAIPNAWASLGIQVKRWHDRDKSGWWILLGLVPILGGLWVLVETGFLRGTIGPNRYGEDPL